MNTAKEMKPMEASATAKEKIDSGPWYKIDPESDIELHEGDYAIFDYKKSQNVVYPWSLIAWTSNKKKFIDNFSPEDNEKFVAQINKINISAIKRPYCIINPIITLDYMYSLGTIDPTILARRVINWKKKHGKIINMPFLPSNSDFQNLAYLCNTYLYSESILSGMTPKELLDASKEHELLAEHEVYLLDVDFFDGCYFNLKEGDGSTHFYISYDVQGKSSIDEVTLTDLFKFEITKQLKNAIVKNRDGIVQITKYFRR